jgi:hypothetical protein
MTHPKGKPQHWQPGRKCQTCLHPQVAKIDFLLVSGAGEHGKGRNAVATKFGLSPGSVNNHLHRHISPEYRWAVMAGPFGSETELRELAAQEGTSVLQSLRVIFNGHRHRWLLSMEAGDDSNMINHARLMSQMLWKIGQLTQEILPTPVIHQNNTVINVLEVPEYVQAITRLSECPTQNRISCIMLSLAAE